MRLDSEMRVVTGWQALVVFCESARQLLVNLTGSVPEFTSLLVYQSTSFDILTNPGGQESVGTCKLRV